MLAVAFALLVLVASLVFLGVIGWRVFRQVRSLGRAVADSAGRLTAAAAELSALERDADD